MGPDRHHGTAGPRHLARRIHTVAKHGATGDPHLGRQRHQPGR